MLLQQMFGIGGSVGLLAAGVLCLALAVTRPQAEKLIVPGGLFTGIGLGIVLTSEQLPLGIHVAVHIASLALGFGAIDALGGAGYREEQQVGRHVAQSIE